jgi:hypothetical protein
MTHPPYGDDAWERGRGDDALPAAGERPRHGEPPGGQPQFGPPGYGPPGQYGPPQYGPPPFAPSGWEQPQQPRRSRRPPFLLGLLVLAAVIGVVLVLPGTRSAALDPQTVQRDVAEQFQQREGVAVDVRCGDDMTVVAGRSYECTGTTADGEKVTITIAITDEDASYTWDEG